MSWQFTFVSDSSVFPEHLDEAIEAANNGGFVAIPDEQMEKGRDAMEVALDAAARIVASGVIGSDVQIRCILGGHANTDHAPEDGWGNDYVSINLSQS